MFWIEFTIAWTIGYMITYSVLRPEILKSANRGDGPWWLNMGPPVWDKHSTAHFNAHFKAYVPAFIALWVVFFLGVVELQN